MQALGRIQILLHRLRERSLGRGHVPVTNRSLRLGLSSGNSPGASARGGSRPYRATVGIEWIAVANVKSEAATITEYVGGVTKTMTLDSESSVSLF